MTMVLNLTPEQEMRLSHFAQLHGKNAEAVLAEMVDALPTSMADNLFVPPARVADLNEGNILYMADDFNDPLPDSFWFPDDEPEQAAK